jgi:hypothetical protein
MTALHVIPVMFIALAALFLLLAFTRGAKRPIARKAWLRTGLIFAAAAIILLILQSRR